MRLPLAEIMFGPGLDDSMWLSLSLSCKVTKLPVAPESIMAGLKKGLGVTNLVSKTEALLVRLISVAIVPSCQYLIQ